MARLAIAFRQWGGVGYYVTPPPRNAMKRWLAQAVLNLAGLAAMKALLVASARLKGGEGDLGRFQPPRSAGDREDADILRAAQSSFPTNCRGGAP